MTPRRTDQKGRHKSDQHGAYSNAQIVPVAQVAKRRLLRQLDLRVADLDPIGRALLDNYARAQAKLELLDRHFAEHGILDEHGEPRSALRVYPQFLNSARHAIARLEDHVEKRAAQDPRNALDAYLAGLAEAEDEDD